MCNRVLSILLASIAEAIAFSSVELANALNLDMRRALLLYSLYDRMHLKDCRGMAISSPFAGHKTAAFCTDEGWRGVHSVQPTSQVQCAECIASAAWCAGTVLPMLWW